MTSPGPDSNGPDTASTNDSPESNAAQDASVSKGGLKAGPLRMGIAGLLIGIAAWQVIHWSFPFYAVPEVKMANPDSPTAQEQEQMGLARFEAGRKNVMTAGLIMGALAGLVFAFVEGVSQGNVAKLLVLSIVTLALGGLLGAVGGYCSMTFQWKYWFDPSFTAMKREMGIQGIFWLAIAAGVGLGVGLHAKRPAPIAMALIQSLLGAVLFVIVYVASAALLFPTDSGERTVPYMSPNVAFWAILGFGLMGVMLGLARPAKKKPA